MSPEMKDKIDIIQSGDTISITDNNNSFLSIEKVISTDSKMIYTKTKSFYRANLTCTVYPPYLIIDDVYFNLQGRIRDFLRSKNYNDNFNYDDENVKVLEKRYSSTKVTIFVYKRSKNFKHYGYLVIKVNGILILSADVESIDDFKVLFKCTLRKFEKR